MTQEQINKEFNDQCNIIKSANDRIGYLRSICKHTKSEKTVRILNFFHPNSTGSNTVIKYPVICADCGTFIEYSLSSIQLIPLTTK